MITTLLLSACGSGELPVGSAAAPAITVSPSAIDFGAVSPGDAAEGVVTVRNHGDATLTLGLLRFDDGGQGFTASASATAVAPQGEAIVTVTFSPAAIDAFSDTLWISSDDADAPMVAVELAGEGLGDGLVIDPTSIDFGVPYVGCELAQLVTVRNEGAAAVTVEEATLTSASGAFTAEIPATPWTLATGEEQTLYVEFVPFADGEDEGLLRVTSGEAVLDVPIAGEAVVYGENVDTFTQPASPTVDVVVALDTSPGMESEVEALAATITTLTDALDALDADWHVSVVTDDDGCVNGAQPYLDPPLSRVDRAALLDVMVSGGRAGVYAEAGFTLLEAATATSNTGVGDCNHGMIRDGAALAFVGVSNEVEQSTYDWSYYVELLQSLKASPDDVVIHAIAGDYPSGCGGHDPGLGWYEASVATGGAFLSICDDWASNLELLAVAVTPEPGRFELSLWPVAETIEVEIDGMPMNTGWSYDSVDNVVVVDPGVLGAGAEVVVRYVLYGECD